MATTSRIASATKSAIKVVRKTFRILFIQMPTGGVGIHWMVSESFFFRDLAYVFLAALLGGGLAWLVRQPLILGYVVGGIVISPFTPGPSVSDLHSFEVFAEIGVILLMYSVGIQFSLRDLWRVKGVALAGGPLGIVLLVGLGLGVGRLLGWPPLQAVVVGMVVSVASTMILLNAALVRHFPAWLKLARRWRTRAAGALDA